MASRGLIIEGVPGTGKSTLLASLHRHLAILGPRIPTLVFTEALTQRVLEPAWQQNALGPADHQKHLEHLINPSLCYHHTLRTRDKKNPQVFAIQLLIERFHLTHTVYYPYLSFEHFLDLERKLADLNFGVVLLQTDGESLSQRLLWDRWPGWLNYVRQYGDANQIIDHYLQQQEYYQRVAKKTRLPVLILDSSRNPTEHVLGDVRLFFERLGFGD